MSADLAREIRYSLTDARALCDALGLLAGKGSWMRQTAGVIVRCPWHEDRSPSCSVRRASDGTLAARCHACGATGDALSLVAAMHGLTMRGDDFRQVMIIAAQIAGLHSIVTELETGTPSTLPRRLIQKPDPEPERGYPSPDSIAAVWGSSTRFEADAIEWATSRGLDAEEVSAILANDYSLARQLPASGELPRWATYRGASWRETGHRVIVPVYDHAGVMRSVRAIRIIDGDGPKRLPPAGHRASGLVQACDIGLAMLRGTFSPQRVLVVEGEPDFLTAATKRTPHAYARLGITSGSWCAEIAARIPEAASVLVYTHTDDAGDRYAAAIQASLPNHRIGRWRQQQEVAA